MKPLLLAPIALLAAACAGGMKDDGSDSGYADASELDGDDELPTVLRFDVSPPGGLATPDVLSQSFWVEPRGASYEEAALALRPTVTLSGTVTAKITQSWPGMVEVPSTVEPIPASISAWVDGTRLGGNALAGDDGAFSLSIPAYEEPYALTVVPEDATVAPFHIDTLSLAEDDVRDYALDLSIPVYGRVTDANGSGIAGVNLHLTRVTEEGLVVRSASFTTDDTGWYVARVEELGTYTVDVEGGVYRDASSTRVIPAVSHEVVVTDEETGAEAYVTLGDIEHITVDGSVLDEGGRSVDQATVRFTSTSLGGAAGSLTVESVSGVGTFAAYLLPGTYEVAYIPPYGDSSSPIERQEVELTSTGSVGNVNLPSVTTIDGVVRLPDGEVGGGVVVAATQEGFDGFTYNTASDDEGRFSLVVPEGSYEVSFTPATSDAAMTWRRIDGGESGVEVVLHEGIRIDGAVTWQDAGVGAWIDVYEDETGKLVGRAISADDGTFALRVHSSLSEDAVTPDREADDTGR